MIIAVQCPKCGWIQGTKAKKYVKCFRCGYRYNWRKAKHKILKGDRLVINKDAVVEFGVYTLQK